MRRRNVEKETVEIDVLQKKNEELKQFVERYDSAVAVVTGTINNLKEINENIGEKIKEIEEYQTELARTRNGLDDTRLKNEQISLTEQIATLEAEKKKAKAEDLWQKH